MKITFVDRPRQQSIEVEVVNGRSGNAGISQINSDLGETNYSPNLFVCFDDAVREGSFTKNDEQGLNVDVDAATHHKAQGSTEPGKPNSSGSSATKLNKRRNITMGLRPKIIIFSEKKDLIRVSLDSDESDGDFLSANTYPIKYHNFKSARRKSIAGDSMSYSTPEESLRGDSDEELQSLSPRVQVTGTNNGVVNDAFQNDEGKSNNDAPLTISKSKEQNIKRDLSNIPSSSAALKPKKGKSKAKTPSGVEIEGKRSLEEIQEQVEKPEEIKPTKSKKHSKERSKSAKNGKRVTPSEKEAEDSDPTALFRPRTATAFNKNTEVTNMSKLVAWDRPEDNI